MDDTTDNKGNVIRLATSRDSQAPACTTCRHYHPNVSISRDKVVTWHLSWPFRRVRRLPDASSHYAAICSYFGGHYASQARQSCEGDSWELRHDTALPAPEQDRQP